MLNLVHLMLPELFLIVVACALFLLGVSNHASHRRLAAMVALIAVALVFAYEFGQIMYGSTSNQIEHDDWWTVRVSGLSHYIKMLTAGVGGLLVLLAWPTNEDATGNGGINYGTECGEFFGLMLLSLAGVFLVSTANDIILLFLAIELASIPTYIMVSVSRPTPLAQEAGVKYFFLGAMAAAVMLFGFSYLYGATGQTRLDLIARALYDSEHAGGITPWEMLAIVMLICGFCFKIAAVPLHLYAGDVYQGAATPVTAFLSFVPKTSGFVAIIKLLSVVGDEHALPLPLIKLLWVLAVLTMFFGNVLGLMQSNVKRVLAYSSIAHSGYMLVGITALAGAGSPTTRTEGLEGVLFYLAAYGIVNTAAFGVLILLPSRSARLAGRLSPSLADSAETFEDIAGQGRKHVGLGLAMAVACFSLIGIPLTIGFLGKVMLIKPALHGQFYWLVVLTMINAAISAAYYLRIVGTMFLRPDPVEAAGFPVVLPASPVETAAPAQAVPAFAARFHMPLPTLAAIVLSVLGTLLLGSVLPATDMLASQVKAGANFDSRRTLPNHVAHRELKASTPLTAAR